MVVSTAKQHMIIRVSKIVADHEKLFTTQWIFLWYELPQTTSELTTIGLIFSNKVLQKLKFSKNVNNEKCTPEMIFFNEKNILGRFG